LGLDALLVTLIVKLPMTTTTAIINQNLAKEVSCMIGVAQQRVFKLAAFAFAPLSLAEFEGTYTANISAVSSTVNCGVSFPTLVWQY
jgi:hypothetical protein